jgi:predicted ester cyclase
LLAALPDLCLDVQEVVATEDRAVAYVSVSGTHRGEFLGALPTGQAVRFDSVDLYRLEGGQIAESWPQPEMESMRQQMGG